MDNKNLDDLIKKSITINEKVPEKIKNNLKSKIYEKENINLAQNRINAKYFIYLFISLSIAFCILLSIITLVFIKNIFVFSIILLFVLSCTLSTLIILIFSLKLKIFNKISI